MSQTGTPQITAQNVLAQLQTDTRVLALLVSGLSNPVALTLSKDPGWAQLQQTNLILLAAMYRFAGFLQWRTPTSKVPGPSDISETAGPIYVTDDLSRNILCAGATPAQVYTPKPASVWAQLPNTTDGGQVWQDQTDVNGQTLVLYGCAPGLLQGSPPTS